MAFGGGVIDPTRFVADAALQPYQFVQMNTGSGHSDMGVIPASTAGQAVVGITDDGGQPSVGMGVEIAIGGTVQAQLDSGSAAVTPGMALYVAATGYASSVTSTGYVQIATALEAGVAGQIIRVALKSAS